MQQHKKCSLKIVAELVAPSFILHNLVWERVGFTSSMDHYCCIQKYSHTWLNKSMDIYSFLTDFSLATKLPVWPVLDCSSVVGPCDPQTLRFLADILFHGKHSSTCIPHSELKINHGTGHMSQKSSRSSYSFHKKCLYYTHDCMHIATQLWQTVVKNTTHLLRQAVNKIRMESWWKSVIAQKPCISFSYSTARLICSSVISNHRVKSKLKASAARGPYGLEPMSWSSSFYLLIFQRFPHSPTVLHKQETLQQVELHEKETSLNFAETVLPKMETKQPGISQFHSAMLKQVACLIPSF